MALSMAAFTTNDSFMKGLLEEISLLQALTLRGFVNIALVLIVLPRIIGPVRFNLSRTDWAYTVLRAFAELGASFSFLTCDQPYSLGQRDSHYADPCHFRSPSSVRFCSKTL